MAQVESCGCAEIYPDKGNEEIYAEKENLQHHGNNLTSVRDWITCSILLSVVARREGNTLTEYWYMIAINSIPWTGK